MSLRAEVVKLYPTALWKGVHGPCQLPLPFNSISYHHDQGQFTEDSHCAEHNSEHFAQAEALHPYKSSQGWVLPQIPFQRKGNQGSERLGSKLSPRSPSL